MDDENLLHGYVDGQLDPAERARVERWLKQDEQARATVAQWQAQREALRDLHLDVLDEPVPVALLAAARGERAVGRGWLWLEQGRQALVAGVLLAVGLGAGWFGRGLWPDGPVADARASVSVGRAIARDAMAAHVVYAPDQRRPVEIGADQQELLLRWLSRRLGRMLQLPALGELGWQLVGGRLLSGDTEGAAPARAQFMYENPDGQRLTLYLSVLARPDTAAASSIKAESAAFGMAATGSTRSFYWTEGDFGYALVGSLPAADLQHLSNEIYAQMRFGPALQAGPASGSAAP